MVMHMSRRQRGRGSGGREKMRGIRERAKETSVPFPLLFFSPPLPLPLFVPAMQAIDQRQVQWNYRCISCAFPCMWLMFMSPSLRVHRNDTSRSTFHFFVLALILVFFDYASHMQLWKLRERRIQHAYDI